MLDSEIIGETEITKIMLDSEITGETDINGELEITGKT